MVGKIIPYIAVGYIQATLILCAARWLFGVPMSRGPKEGSVAVVVLCICIGFVMQEQPHDIHMPIRARSHERGAKCVTVRLVDFCSVDQ